MSAWKELKLRYNDGSNELLPSATQDLIKKEDAPWFMLMGGEGGLG